MATDGTTATMPSDNEVQAHHEYPPESIRGQLAGWHAGRGDKSFARAMIPTWKATGSEAAAPYNPLKLFNNMKTMDWLYFFTGWWAWTCDGYDYFAVSVTLLDLTEQFGRTKAEITTAMTLTLLFRSLGAVIFGVLADRFGRRWTLTVNLVLIAIFELGSGLVNTYTQFLGVRACFGIVMGGVWGQAMATSLENVPVQARGFCSGILQPGYSFGYLLAAVINLGVTPKHGWRAVYYIGAGFTMSCAILRAALPETEAYRVARAEANENRMSSGEKARAFGQEMKAMIKTNWLRCIWGIFVMTGYNFLAHGSQDLFVSKGQTPHQANIATIVCNVGAVVGGAVAGYMSQYAGRRLAAIIFLCGMAAFIPLWILPNNFAGLTAGGFWIMFFMQGSWGMVPIYLNEISPPAFRSLFAGLAYQIGNMASSGAAQIEAEAGESLTIVHNGKVIPDYASIQGILVGAVIAFLLVCIVLGPEADWSNFETAKVGIQAGAGATETQDLVHVRRKSRAEPFENEKGDVMAVEHK